MGAVGALVVSAGFAGAAIFAGATGFAALAFLATGRVFMVLATGVAVGFGFVFGAFLLRLFACFLFEAFHAGNFPCASPNLFRSSICMVFGLSDSFQQIEDFSM